MYKYLGLILLVAFSFQVEGQRYRNPESYFRKFQNENRKIRIKNLRYLKSSLKQEDPRRVDRYREMVLEQVKESRQSVSRLGDYNGYDVLQKEYMSSLDMYIDAFENNFGIADTLSANRYKSYDHLKQYYDAVTKAEDEMLEASYRIEAAEEHFAKNHKMNLVRDAELEEQYAMLDEVTLYSRDMTLAFFRVDAQVRRYLNLIAENKDSLNDVLGDMRQAIKESKTEVELYADFDGEKDLYNEMLDYLEEMQDEVNTNLGPLTEQLQNEYLEEDEYEDAQRDLKRFIKNHEYRVESYFSTKNDLIEDYLPED